MTQPDDETPLPDEPAAEDPTIGDGTDTDAGAVEAAAAGVESTSSAELVQAMADRLPDTRLQAAAPTRTARSLAFVSILIGGVCGGLIGFAFTDLQCDDGCTVWAGISGVVGAALGAVGVAIVAVLVLRAMDEWETVKESEPGQHPARRRPG